MYSRLIQLEVTKDKNSEIEDLLFEFTNKGYLCWMENFKTGKKKKRFIFGLYKKKSPWKNNKF